MKNKIYKDRFKAGQVLARILKEKDIADGVIMAIPRGGVVVAAQVSEALKLPLDIIIPRKIGAPRNPEFAIGAVTQDGTVILAENEYLLQMTGKEAINKIIEKEIHEIKRRMIMYRGNVDYPDYTGKTIIIVDDGIATGFTTRAAVMSIKKVMNPERTILAVPVAPAGAIQSLDEYVDEIICPLVPEPFYAVGQFYENFDQVPDDMVIQLLSKTTPVV